MTMMLSIVLLFSGCGNKNYYNEPLNNPFNRTNNDFTSSQFFLNKMKILYDNNNNNSYINFISINCSYS